MIRLMSYRDMPHCCNLVAANWGLAVAERAHDQMIEYFKGGRYAPQFAVATVGENIAGFCAYEPSMLMKGAYNFIWIAVDRSFQSEGIGKALTLWRITEVEKRGGQMIQLVTQKPAYFSKFGFFKLHHIGNEWYVMLKLLTTKADI